MVSEPGASRLRTRRSASPIVSASNNAPNEDRNETVSAIPASQEDPIGGEAKANESRQRLPWWKRPGPWWLLILAPFSNIALAAITAPQVELFTTLACRGKFPESESQPLTSIVPYSSLHYGSSVSSPSFTSFVENVIAKTRLKRPSVESLNSSNPCVSDPAVQASVANLMAVTSTLLGILTFVTCGWWGSFSDRHGRKKMIGVAAIGQLLSSFNCLIVAKYAERIPGGYYWLLIVDSATIGVLGGFSSEGAAMFAYMSDVAPPMKRSRVFSLLTGFILLGVGIGPLLGSIIVRLTHNILSVFYMAAIFRIVQAAFVWFILPESLSTFEMNRASLKYQELALSTDESTLLRHLQRLLFFLEPLSILIPEKPTHQKSLAGVRRDWNLPILVLSYGLIILASSSLMNQLLYAVYRFEWGSEYLGYCLSGIGVTRATYLTLILPFIVAFMKRRHTTPNPRSGELEPLLPNHDLASHTAHAFADDLNLARFSIVVDMATFAALPFAPTSFTFILFIMLGSLGAAIGPAINSVALEIYSRKFAKNEPKESGKLFGALSVVQCLFGQILGPPLYGLIYAATVATLPRTIFFLALGSALVAFTLLSFVRLNPASDNNDEGADDLASA